MGFPRVLSRLLLVFVVVKSVQALIIAFTPGQFDVSSRILLEKYSAQKAVFVTFHSASPWLNSLLTKSSTWLTGHILEKMVTWDAVYFSDLFVNDLQYEHQFVFCPLWWRMVRWIPVNATTAFYSRLLFATLLSNTCHFGAAVVLYYYTQATFTNARIFSWRRMAMASSVLFICSPAAAFMTAPYSESAASLCSFTCLYMRELAMNRLTNYGRERPAHGKVGPQGDAACRERERYSMKQELPFVCLYVGSGVFAAVAFGLRANCLLLGLIYIHDLCAVPGLGCRIPVITGSILGVAFVAAQVHGYYSVCHGTDRGEWCLSRVPSLFAYAQAHYWNNGFLNYWTMGNLPNFVFAAPTVVLSALSVRYFAYMYPVARVVPVLVVTAVYLVLQCLFWHVQIVTRVHTFLPILYWMVAGLATQGNVHGQKWAGVALAYFAVWNVMQVALFAAFLPPA